ncbi:AT-rich interactive domain-containing protein 5B [Ixodes scapularis]|uniref:At-rich interactive domain-containing protein 5B, putative n=1 Tax=Ixodes scapularis TaxID=6945 RepID=B7PXK3_IXOSC|nr:AT-rich interactive domain-containing protein 5B [Ixodes scapularis]EEC11325.1 at-rich interactive domain-containing protein 5B, putative [Ixodes scapularis]|eukprot:XP_002401006.1 at-rich interactive domain-containing protein 5B, putative [Ixodes scapularis]
MSFVGDPRGRSGHCTFYGAFEYRSERGPTTLCVGQFVFVRLSPSDDPCIAELLLLWKDHQHSSQLASVQLYFLPEQTPDGRLPHQGQHEVLAASEKAVLGLDDLVSCITEDVDWTYGLLAGSPAEAAAAVVVLSFPRYCRYRATLKRLEGQQPAALAGVDPRVPRGPCWVVFCRDTFDHEALAHNDLICDHLAPPERGRQQKRSHKHNSGSESSEGGNSPLAISSAPAVPAAPQNRMSNGADEFLQRLFQFMKERNTPIQRVPHLGFKQIDLYHFYQFSQRLGGYEKITGRKQWKQVYDQLGGDPSSTSAATCTRRHYERLLLPFELHLRDKECAPCWDEPSSDCQVLDLSVRRQVAPPSQCLDLRVHRRGDDSCVLQRNAIYSVYRLEDAMEWSPKELFPAAPSTAAS